MRNMEISDHSDRRAQGVQRRLDSRRRCGENIHTVPDRFRSYPSTEQAHLHCRVECRQGLQSGNQSEVQSQCSRETGLGSRLCDGIHRANAKSGGTQLAKLVDALVGSTHHARILPLLLNRLCFRYAVRSSCLAPMRNPTKDRGGVTRSWGQWSRREVSGIGPWRYWTTGYMDARLEVMCVVRFGLYHAPLFARLRAFCSFLE